jgi:hypothetical protein
MITVTVLEYEKNDHFLSFSYWFTRFFWLKTRLNEQKGRFSLTIENRDGQRNTPFLCV